MSEWNLDLLAERIARLFRRYTIRELAWKAFRKLCSRTLPQWCSVYIRANCVDELDGIVTLWDTHRVDGLPAQFIKQLEIIEGDTHTKVILEEKQPGLSVYLIAHGEKVVGICRSKRGQFIDRWYRPLDAEDIVIYGVTVFAEHRGRGYAPAAYEALCRLNNEAKNIYIDAHQNNKAAIRAIEKAGFLIEGVYRVGAMKHI